MSKMNFFRRSSACVFCDVVCNPGSKALHETSSVLAIEDIRPATEHHYLVIPKQHLADAKALGAEHLPLFREMVDVARELVEKRVDEGERSDVVMGCTWPPFTTVSHLHLHVLSPASAIKGLFGYFSKSWWFVSPEAIIDRLQSMN